MIATDYLRGGDEFSQWRVEDLVKDGGKEAELIFLFESPHVDERKAGLPVVGSAGRSALGFLLPEAHPGESLGRFVRERHEASDGRLAIMNVCNVPMQAAAFGDDGGPGLAADEWALIEKIRTSIPKSISRMRLGEKREVSEGVAQALGERFEALHLGAGCRVVAAGRFAQLMVNALPDGMVESPLRVPHPSYNQWNRVENLEKSDLSEVRTLFRQSMG